MNALHVFSLPLHANPGRLDPCVSRHWIAVPLTKTVIGIWRVSTTDSKSKPIPVELAGHSREINALAFSNSHKQLLASACKDKILTWDLQSENITSKVFFSKPGDVTVMCLNNNDEIIATGVDFNIQLLKSGHKDPLAILDAHKGIVSGLAFCPHYSATLVSISDDRSFCVWDVRDMVLLYQSVIISPAPLISLSMNRKNPHVVIGTADGSIKIFDLTDGNDFRQLTSVNLASKITKTLEKVSQSDKNKSTRSTIVTKRGKWQNPVADINELPTTVEASESVVSVEYVYFTQTSSEVHNSSIFMASSSGAGDVLEETPPSICVVTSNALVQVNSRTFQILDVINLQESVHSLSFASSRTVGSTAYAAMSQTGPSQVIVVMGSMFETKIDVLQWSIADGSVSVNSGTSDFQQSAADEESNILTIIPTSVLLDTSPLKAEMPVTVSSKPVTKGDVATGKKKSPGMMNQPLTFKSQIKSSGYSQAPRTTMFKPETSKAKLLNIDDKRKAKPDKLKDSIGKMLKAEYDTKRGPPVIHCDTFEVDNKATAVFKLRFTDDGSKLGCALSNKCALALKVPYSKQISTSYIGHNNVVNSVHWNSSGDCLVTSSNDKSVLLWDKAGWDPLMTLTHQKGTVKELQHNKESSASFSKTAASSRKLSSSDSSSSSLSSLASGDNKLFQKEIKHAQFFYVDKFILLTHGPELLLFKYHLTPDRDEIKRYQSRNRYKLVSSWQTSSSTFTASAAVNAFLSHLVVCATSSKNLEVYDLNRATLAHTFHECHSRPVHCIAMNEGSCFSSQSSEAFNIIATSSPTDPIKLWDLRSRGNVQALQGHLNNAHACQFAFSPCGNYVASGSEDKVVYIYDLRTGTYCERLRGHNEAVTSVAFHPAQPLLATGSLNGKVLFFKAK